MRKKEQKILNKIAAQTKEIQERIKSMDQAKKLDKSSLNKLLKSIRAMEEKAVILRFLNQNQESPQVSSEATSIKELVEEIKITAAPVNLPPKDEVNITATPVNIPSEKEREEISVPITPVEEVPSLEQKESATEEIAPVENDFHFDPEEAPFPTPEVMAIEPEQAEQPAPEETPKTPEPAIAMDRIEKEMANLGIEDEESINDKLSREPDEASVVDKLQKQPIGDLRSAIALNERFSFSNELFNGNMEVFMRALDEINHMQRYEEAKRFLEHQEKKFNWSPGSEIAGELKELVERRFL